MCVRCEVRFFVRLYKIDAGILAYVKEILCKIKENLQADDVQSFQAVFVRRCLKYKSLGQAFSKACGVQRQSLGRSSQ